jgi:thiosulfate/3-mercaptopyruvate sulfurtransferase
MTDVLVPGSWVAKRVADPGFRVIEVSSNGLAEYGRSHIPAALGIDWRRELVEKDDESSGLVIDAERFARLARRLGLSPDDTLVFYGDEGGRHAARALWTFAYYRHSGPLHLIDGGREKWQAQGRPMVAQIPLAEPSEYPVPTATNESLRATREEIVSRLDDGPVALLDVRDREEYEGIDVRAARGGHIPCALNTPWQEALTPEWAFKPEEELAALHRHLKRAEAIVAYCQIGNRAAHTWFALCHVLGYPDVKLYDGSWQEWGNLPDTPIER